MFGIGYASYDNFREFARMTAAFDGMVDHVRSTIHRTFCQEELLALTDLGDFLRRTTLRYNNNCALLPVIHGGLEPEKASRSGSVAACCAATLKLIDRAYLQGCIADRESVSELADFCRWQWLHHDAVQENDL